MSFQFHKALLVIEHTLVPVLADSCYSLVRDVLFSFPSNDILYLIFFLSNPLGFCLHVYKPPYSRPKNPSAISLFWCPWVQGSVTWNGWQDGEICATLLAWVAGVAFSLLILFSGTREMRSIRLGKSIFAGCARRHRHDSLLRVAFLSGGRTSAG